VVAVTVNSAVQAAGLPRRGGGHGLARFTAEEVTVDAVGESERDATPCSAVAGVFARYAHR